MYNLFVSRTAWIGCGLFTFGFIGLFVSLSLGLFYPDAGDTYSLSFTFRSPLAAFLVLCLILLFGIGNWLIVLGNKSKKWKEFITVYGIYILAGLFSLELFIRSALAEFFGINLGSPFLIYGILIAVVVLVAFIMLLSEHLQKRK